MRVKMNQAVAGPNMRAGAGQVLTVDDETGAAWIANGYASAVETAAFRGAPETATAPGGSTATAPAADDGGDKRAARRATAKAKRDAKKAAK